MQHKPLESRDNCSHVRLRALGLALVVLLTFVLCWDTLLPARTVVLVLPIMLTEVPPSLSHILFLFGFFSVPLDPLLYGAFTLGC
ncbi:gonadotropin-releasing hormone ii receptor [Lynx pardinus]|uniref:Gonadotropin-releasing hormone ii receptor n=1 Tax=Lynx pardinus TaxID=191816 RepID=A0A485MIA1_LYNPA|nr:gonadotropin-releasing hormone ii receptor [Lynx pardinus]